MTKLIDGILKIESLEGLKKQINISVLCGAKSITDVEMHDIEVLEKYGINVFIKKKALDKCVSEDNDNKDIEIYRYDHHAKDNKHTVYRYGTSENYIEYKAVDIKDISNIKNIMGKHAFYINLNTCKDPKKAEELLDNLIYYIREIDGFVCLNTWQYESLDPEFPLVISFCNNLREAII